MYFCFLHACEVSLEMNFISRIFFTKLGKQFRTNSVQFSNGNQFFQPYGIVNIQKRFQSRLKKPNLYVSSSKKYDNPYEPSGKVGIYGYLLLSIPIGTFLLGVWQIQRRKWKLNLIQELNERIIHEPLELPADLEELKSMEYYPIKVKGTFLYDKEFVQGIRNLVLDGEAKTDNPFSRAENSKKGYWIITPFKLSGQDLTILVNRGWIPRSLKSPDKRKNLEINDEVEITGILRLNEPRPQFVPKNKPNEGDLWYYRDVNAMAEKAEAAPIYIEMVRNKGSHTYPIAGQTQVVLRNEHLSYIVTWFSLSAATSYMWYRQILKRSVV